MTDTNDIYRYGNQAMLKISGRGSSIKAIPIPDEAADLIEQQQGAMTDTNVLINQMSARIEELETKVQLQLNYIKRLQIESIEGKTDD